MSGVNLIDFAMPSPIPTPTGGKAETRNVGGMKLVLPRNKAEHTKAEKEEQAKKADWWKALLPLLGIIIVIKLATWYVRRKR